MEFDIPASIRSEHEELHARLERAMKESGAVGDAAREVARLLHPHFIREEDFALPPQALLPELAHGGVRTEMLAVLPMTRRLQAELPNMLDEHRQIVHALERLRQCARAENLPEYERFADALMQHARTEEEILYPAAILVGDRVARGAST